MNARETYASILLALGFALQVFVDRPLSEYLMLALLLASLGASWTLWRGAPLLFLIGSATGLAFEVVGLSTGLPFGAYTYTWRAPRVFGVPVPVVFAWGTYLYASYLSALPLAGRWKRALAATLYMVLLDLGVDPVMVEKGLWSWSAQCPCWFGVPLTNYLGWATVSASAILIYQRLVKREPVARPVVSFTVLAACLPILKEASGGALLPALASFALLATASTALYIVSRKAWNTGSEKLYY